MLRIYNRLIELGILTAEEGLEAIDTGRLPDKEMSLKSQEEFKELRDQGLYEPLIGGKNQAEIKKEAGRPEGAPAPTPEQNPAGQGEQSNAVNYSLTKVTDNLTKASKAIQNRGSKSEEKAQDQTTKQTTKASRGRNCLYYSCKRNPRKLG